jgi:hypothetical protein
MRLSESRRGFEADGGVGEGWGPGFRRMKTRSASLLHSKLDALWHCKFGKVRRIVRTARSINEGKVRLIGR